MIDKLMLGSAIKAGVIFTIILNVLPHPFAFAYLAIEMILLYLTINRRTPK